MTTRPTDSATERRAKRKGLALALLLHGAVVAAFIYPFLTSTDEIAQPYEMLVELDFREAPASSASASAKDRVRNEVKQPVAEREAAPRNPAPPTLPPPPAPPILTSPSPAPTIPDVAPVPLPDRTPTPAPSTEPVVVDVPAPRPGPAPSRTDGHGTTAGTGDKTGAPETGHGSTVSDVGQGRSDAGEGLEGTGLLRRAVIYRPPLHSVVRSNGRIAMNICVNRSGHVTAVKWNEELSTITDRATIHEALAKATDYKFESDRSAPTRECGVMTIIVSGLDKLH